MSVPDVQALPFFNIGIIVHTGARFNQNRRRQFRPSAATWEQEAHSMKQYNVGIIGCTGMVGQRFMTLMENHPWFQLTAIAASARSAGKTYAQAVEGRWALDVPMPEEAKDLVVLDAEKDAEQLASHGGLLLLRGGYEEGGDPGPGGEVRQAGVPHRLQQLRPPVDGRRAHGGAGDQPGPPGGHRGPAQAPGHEAGLHRREDPTAPSRATSRPCTP